MVLGWRYLSSKSLGNSFMQSAFHWGKPHPHPQPQDDQSDSPIENFPVNGRTDTLANSNNLLTFSSQAANVT
ncbi:unnamed protein product [Adineta ricciae]|uniref:Uncharacterized protein n=1 Tax=Adineta ricciae TaxID=249248 RepID=A0A815D813_ADIRI|nr:unnamed protein product [Adineta ricciae]CAF1434671.1 unnamed protein product [Adineta ricciae]